MRNRKIYQRRQNVRRSFSFWMMAWALFAIVGCPFWCDTSSDSPFSAWTSVASASTPADQPSVPQATASTPDSGQKLNVHQLSQLSSFDFDEFCRCGCFQAAQPAPPQMFAAPFVVVTVNPRPIVLQSAIYGRARPSENETFRSTFPRSPLLGRDPPLSV